jgi:hypothetical protein
MAGSAMRGSRIGAGPMGEAERGELAPRISVSFWCHQLHETRLAFADDPSVLPPETTDCRQCGALAGRDIHQPPQASKSVPYKTHMAYVLERRTQAEGDALVDAALKELRRR